jgi:hypothetical protein
MRKLRYLILPALLILGLSATVGITQTINKALQLSQDARGAFGVDTTNNVYFPGHILNTGTAGPAPTVAGTGTPTIAGSDVAGSITMGTSATTATVTFGRAYVSVPQCVVTWNTAASGLSPISYTLNTTSIVVTQPAVTGNRWNYFCTAAS